MKKIIIISITIFCLLLAISFYCYYSYQSEVNQVATANAKYQKYQNKAFKGNELITIMNQIMDDNTKNNVAKNDNKEFIENDTNSIKAEVHFIDNGQTYLVETIYAAGIEGFAKNFSSQAFQCTKIEYHEKTKRIRYLYFEQI